jgi:hypothetical protein
MSNIPYLRQLDDNSTVIAKDLTAMATALSTIPASFNIYTLYESGALFEFYANSQLTALAAASSNVVVNMIGLGDPSKYKVIFIDGKGVIQIKNANLLTNLQDVGTTKALNLGGNK